MMIRAIRTPWLLTLMGLLFCLHTLARADELPQTAPLVETGDLADLMMTGLHRFAERKFDQTTDQRAAL